jgi:tetratricopeptide (TPR) repeat protein
MIDSAREPDSQSSLIAASFQRVLAESGPRQAEVLRRCAIPRWFDLDVLAVLRERADGNERVLELLRGYSFVREIGGGRYAYQDEVRAMLLAEWRAGQPAELRAISARLADHFATRDASPPPDQIALPPMMVVLSPPGEADLWRREALYHRLIADPAGGLALLRAAFDQAEADYRLADAEALLQLTADAQLDQAGARWVRFMRARIERAALRLDAAVAQLDALLAEPALEARLAAEARQTLGETLTELGQWARATELYRASLAHFEQSGDRRRAAEVMLRLGEAYRGLGVNTGGWYLPAFSQRPLARALGRAWYGLLALPFVLAAAFLRHTPWTLPRPQYAAPYQNWLLIRIYRTAQSWYERARDESAALGDALGQLRAEQQLAEVLLLFGYPEAALARLDELRARLAPQDSYRRLWIDNDRAAALIELGRLPAAQAILSETLGGFQTLGDERGRAAALALQGRAAADSGAADAALASYRDSLARFRALRYTAAREQALYALRAWQRQVGPGPISQAINEMLDGEPEKRYMARFPRSLLPQLQALVLGVVPLGLVLTALVAPTEVVRRVGDSAIVSSQMTYNLWNVVVVLLLLYLLSLAAYGLVALGLIFFIRLEAIEREQPDFLITDERGIARYDYRGALAQSIGWREIRRWIRVDRRLWRRPMLLFSLTLLEAADGRDLRVDGIVGWYGGLQRDIELHLRGAGNPAQPEPRGVEFLRSGWGAMLLAGVALLLLCISNDNSWTDWTVRLLGPGGYAAVALLGYSGALILIPLAYWLVGHPLALHRALGLNDHWPWFAGAGGLGAIGLALFGARVLPIDALRVALLLWGVYALAEALFTILFPRRGRLGAALIAAALLITALLAASPLTSAYYDTLRATYTRLADYASAAQVPLESGQAAQAEQWEQLGNQLYLADRYREAIAAYDQAIALLQPLADQPEARQKIAVLTYNRAATLRKLGLPNWEREFERACAQSEALCGLAPR